MKVSITVLGELSALHSDVVVLSHHRRSLTTGAMTAVTISRSDSSSTRGHDQKIENGLVAEKAETEDRDCA